jgi:two-component sensor histidine kinase
MPQNAIKDLRDALQDFPIVIATVPASRADRRVALGIILLLSAVAALVAPAANVQLAQVDAFIPVIQAALSVADLITAVLLFAQYSILPQRALLALASGYVFSGLFAFLQTLAFPGAYSPTGLIGDGVNTAGWLFALWHTAFPLAVITYTISKDAGQAVRLSRRSILTNIYITITSVFSVIAGLTWIATTWTGYLPSLYEDLTRQTQFAILVNAFMWLLSTSALVLLLLRGRTILDLWLIVTVIATFPDHAVGLFFTFPRFTVGWYAARTFALVASCTVLSVMLTETTMLYARLATAISLLKRERENKKRQEDQIHLLMREVNHRSKNMLSLVQAIARQTLAANPDDFLDRFGKRVEALAANQDLLVKNAWKGADLNELVRTQLATFEDLIGTRIDLQGPHLFVFASAAQALGMALHELATNAGKYGALSAADGRVDIAWGVQRNEDGKEIFVMSWREHCAHPITAPAKQGFGSFVISGMVEISLGAQVKLDWPVTGLIWHLRCATSEVVEGSAGSVPIIEDESGIADRHQLTSQRPRVLVVEDEALVAMEIAHALTGAGFDVVGPARSVPAALEFLKWSKCDAAVLDINLGRETSEAIAIELTANKTPFVTLSGYSSKQHHSVFAGAPMLGKPLRLQFLIAEVKKCIEQKAGVAELAEQPQP